MKAKRRRKRQPGAVAAAAAVANGGGGGEQDTRTNDGAGQGTTLTTLTKEQFLSAAAASNNRNNNKHRNIYSSADNDKEAFLRNYELNINSAALRRMRGFKQGRRKVPSGKKEEEGEEVEEEEDIMLSDDDNAGVLNAVAAVQNGDMGLDKNRDDNWLDETDEYYPSRDHFSDLQNLHMPFWDSYDSINQLYLEIGGCPQFSSFISS